MASGWLVLVLRMENTAAVDMKNQIVQGTIGSSGKYYGRRGVNGVSKMLARCAGGMQMGNQWLSVLDSTAALATGQVACVQANAATDFVRFTFGGQLVTLTEGTDFARGASNTTCAAALAAAINANVILGGLMTAVGSVGNCNLTMKVPTQLAGNIVISTNDGTAFSFTQFTGGTAGAAQFFLQHFDLNRPA